MLLIERYVENALKLEEYIKEHGIEKELGELLVNHLSMANEILEENNVLSCGK